MKMSQAFAAVWAVLSATMIPVDHTWAHDGHGLTGSHWHATDVWGFALALAVAVVMWWWSRNK
ncbi:MAG: hypothetical protein EBS16_08280 [Betaproteobacteria bacterium]|jgi:hypothetical protein|nr:hypothetical protein [Betaproteobacteria bacterium]